MSQAQTRFDVSNLFERSSVARYIQLASLFRKKIESGEWELGAQIPTVEMLEGVRSRRHDDPASSSAA